MTSNYVKAIIYTIVIILSFFEPQSGTANQDDGKKEIEELIYKADQGDYSYLDEIFRREDSAVPVLLNRVVHPEIDKRITALDLLTRIDLQDDNILNREEIIQVIQNVINGTEVSDELIDEALRALAWIDPHKSNKQMVDNLLTQLKLGHAERALFVLGRIGDSSLRPWLEPYAEQKGRIGDMAKQVLAKLGDQRYLAEILADLEMPSLQRSEALRKLVYIDNQSTIRAIARLLYDRSAPPIEAGATDIVVFLPYSYEAASALGMMVENPPMKKGPIDLTVQDIEIWQNWWETHQQEYP